MTANLNSHPLFDEHKGLISLGDVNLLREMVQLLLTELITIDKPALQQAFDKKDYQQLGDIAHKIKGGALYCGTLRLIEACKVIELLSKKNQALHLPDAYWQLDDTISATEKVLTGWLQETS